MKRTILIFGGITVAILLLLELSKFSLLNSQKLNDLYLIIFSALFILLGVLISRLIYKRSYNNNQNQRSKEYLNRLRISKQELRVLELMSDGLSNSQIADALFITENTVKTHVSKILSKLNAKRRTQAVKIGRDLNII